MVGRIFHISLYKVWLSFVSFVVGLFMLDGKHSTTAKVLASVGGGVCLLVICYLWYKYKQNA